MTDLFDLEAEMLEDVRDPEWDAKVARARERVAAFQALPLDQQHARMRAPCDGTCRDPEMIRIATRIS